MNMICCAEHCRYQQDGLCALPPGAPLGARVNGCCYYRPAEGVTGVCSDTESDRHR